MYLEYADYVQMGGMLEEGVFARLEMRAEKCIDRLTHGRLHRESGVRECVRLAVWQLIGAMNDSDEHGGRSVEQLSNDSVSVRYASDRAEAGYARIVREYLSGETTEDGTELIYAGVDA